jgi:hypothetical protein
MSALRFVAWGMLDVDTVDDLIMLEHHIQEELEEHGMVICAGVRQLKGVKNSELGYRLLGPPKAHGKQIIRPYMTYGPLRTVCKQALELIDNPKK